MRSIRLLLAVALALAACEKDKDKKDRTAPTVTVFTVPATSISADIPIATLTATDDVGVSGYLVTEDVTAPRANDDGWSGAAPTSHTVVGEGAHALHAWAKDAAGNVSADRTATVLVDWTAPTLTAFTVPPTSTSADVPITSLSATDNLGVAGYLVSESAIAPLADDPRWTAMAPASLTLAADGTHTLHAWARDAAGNVSPGLTATVRRVSRVTVLFTTDEHSHLYGFSPEVDDFPAPSASGTGAIVGGMARIAAVLQAERNAASTRSTDTITVSAGDFSQGTLASAAFLALSPELVLMKKMGYDAVALGNHEFDLGPTALAGAVTTALGAGGIPPLVLTNAFFDPVRAGDDVLATLYGPGKAIAPSRIVETPGGFRIGIVGAMGIGAGIDAAAASPLAFWDPRATTPAAQFGSIVATVQQAVTALRTQGVNAVIVLGHGGIGATPAQHGDDELLAANVTGIDLLVSGHTHFSTPAPILVQDPQGRMVPVVQPKPYGKEVGRVELVFDGSARPAIDPARTLFIPVDDRIAPSADPQILAVLGSVKGYLEVGPGAPASFLERTLSYVEGADVGDDPNVLGDLYFRVLGHTSVDVIGLGFGETNGMNLDTDAMLAAARSVHTAHPTVAAVQARGSIRSDLRVGKTGDITFADVFDVVSLGADPTVSVPSDPAGAAAVLPKIPGYPLVRFNLWTVELRAALEVGLLQSMRDPDFFVGPSGLVVDYDMTRTPLFDPAAPLGPGWIKRIAVVDEAGVEGQLLYDVAQPGWNGSHFVADPFALQPIVATYYVASFAQLAGVTLKDDDGAPLASVAAGILRRGDESAVKDHEALAKYIRDQCLSNGGELPARYGEPVPRRMRVSHPPPAVLPVEARSGAMFDVAGTTWTRCEANSPAAGQSYAHAWTFGTATATIVHDVHTDAVDCSGPVDPGVHFEVTMTFATGPERTVGWQDAAPAGYPASIVASGVTYSGVTFPSGDTSVKGVAFVDDTTSPAQLFLTNPGDPLPPPDADGYPTLIPNFSSAEL